MKLDKLKRTIKEGIRDMSIIWANEMKMTVKDEAVLIFFLLASTIYPFLYSKFLLLIIYCSYYLQKVY